MWRRNWLFSVCRDHRAGLGKLFQAFKILDEVEVVRLRRQAGGDF